MHHARCENNDPTSEFTPEWEFGGTHRTIPLTTFIDELEPGEPSIAAVQTIQWDADRDRLVHVYVNDGLQLTLTPAEARTLAAMLNLSAGEADDQGPDIDAVSQRSALRAA
jgi:hypothetical protein